MIFVDVETFCETPIKRGTAKYAEKAELMLLAYALGDGEVNIWDVTSDPVMPADLKVYLASDVPICAHNAAFESAILTPLFNIDPKRWRCAMAKCYAHALPGSLENAGIVLGLATEQQKLKEGHHLMRLFCILRPESSKLKRATRHTHPKEWEKFKEYCKQDVSAMREVWKRSPSWNYPNAELDFWHLDQKINRKGIAVDLELARAAIEIAEERKKANALKTQELTEGQVQSATQRDALIGYISDAYDIKFDDLKGSTVETFLEKMIDIPQELGDLLVTRLQSTRTSAAKYKRIFTWESEGRLKYTLQYCGASRTSRFSGRGPQGQNLKRPEKYVADQWEFVAQAIKTKSLDLFFDDEMDVLASYVRGTLVPEKGKKFVVADLAGIEGAVLPWLAGDEAHLKRIRDEHAGIGFDDYVWTYARMFNRDPKDVTKALRTKGKPMSLAFGYGGGPGAFVSMAAIYGVDLEEMTAEVRETLPKDILKEAEGMWEWAVKKRMTRGLKKEVFVACDSLKRMWRRDHDPVVRLWAALEANFKAAIENPAKDFTYKLLTFRRDGNWLRILLPCGTYLCYPSPRVDKKGLSFMGIRQFTKKWERLYTFGGRLAENVTSSTARGVLKHGLIEADRHGYDPVTHSHDEIVAETPDTPDYTAEGLSELMTTGIGWAVGLPLAAAGFESYRYKKE